jgi:hypothetical protein
MEARYEPSVSTWNAIYFAGDVPTDFRPAVEGNVPVRRVGAWTELGIPGVQDCDAVALELSARVSGYVIRVLIQTTASVFDIVHCERGRVIRRIGFSDSRWVRVEGVPQPWELGLFSHQSLTEALEVEDDDASVRADFAKGTLEVGQMRPHPREWESLWRALAVTKDEWFAARAEQAPRTLIGRRMHRLTAVTGVAAIVSLALLAAGIATHGDARAVLASITLPLVVLTLGLATVRRAVVGRSS